MFYFNFQCKNTQTTHFWSQTSTDKCFTNNVVKPANLEFGKTGDCQCFCSKNLGDFSLNWDILKS